MEDKKILNDKELEKVTGGAAKVVGAGDGTTTEDTVDAGTLIIEKNGKNFGAAGAKMK
ncbi:MAG: bacteriocin [Clostridia bacterium]|nr:bacteriocin [Clostridia bacterium]